MKDNFKKIRTTTEPFWIEDGYDTRFQDFQNLMRFRIRDVLIVSSLYDFYIFEEDGRLYELLQSEYRGLNLSHTPELTQISTGKEGIALIKEEKRFDLIIITLHVEDMRPATFVKEIRKEGIEIPIVMLAFDNKELADMLAHKEDVLFDQVFIWMGNFRLLLAIIKHLEDRQNVKHDTNVMGVQSIILIEDNIRYYSFLLPLLYVEIINQSYFFIKEGINLSHKNLRQRARPKILLCKNYEDAWEYYQKYHETVLGIISDIAFPRNGESDPEAGLKFAKEVHKKHSDIPILFQSSLACNEAKAVEIGCYFMLKDVQTLLKNLQQFIADHLGFSDFIFRMPDGREVGRAHDLLTLEKQLKLIPKESFKYHAERNDFSRWLKARTEFWLAHELRPRKISDFPSIDDTRNNLISTLREYRKIRQRGIISEFYKELFDPSSSISRIGGGSLGGKARGLSFLNTLITYYNIQDYFDGVRIFVPPAVVVATDIFDQFLEMNDLRSFALRSDDDKQIIEKFLSADQFPEKAIEDLTAFLELVEQPLAVRSSGLLEDSQIHPFAGVYETYMIPNCHSDLGVRLSELLKAIKRVYASTFFQSVKRYIMPTSFQLENEKMAVIVQILCGSVHGDRFYPVLSGTAQSYNYYPIAPQRSEDGIVSAALGLGKMVVEGGASIRFCPKYPRHVYQLSTPKLALENNQRDFFALNLFGESEVEVDAKDYYVQIYTLRVAEGDGTLVYVGSTYSQENDAIYDDVSSKGVRLVSLAPILKNDIFPLPEIIKLLLDLGRWGMGTPVDIEFAVDLVGNEGELKQFSLLQIRPMVLTREVETVSIEKSDPQKLMCQSCRVLGNGIIDTVFDIVMVNPDQFKRERSREVAEEVSRFNSRLLTEQRPYLLITMGRLGSLDPWLGIPVKWDHISGARAIIEAGLKDSTIDLSQGSHFLENLNSFSIGYFTVPSGANDSFIDWDWLMGQEPLESMNYTRLLRFDERLLVKMNGRENIGIIFKPGINA